MSAGEQSERRGMLRVRPTLGQLCWIIILALIGIVQVVRAQPFDALFFAAAVATTTLDAVGLLPAASAPRRLAGRVLVGAAAVVALVLGLLPRHHLAVIAAVLVLGAAVLVLVWPGAGERHRWTRGIRNLAWWWAIIVVIGCLWELFAFILSLVAPTARAPALSDLLNPMLADRVGQLVFAVLWVALGVWLVRRVVRR